MFIEIRENFFYKIGMSFDNILIDNKKKSSETTMFFFE